MLTSTERTARTRLRVSPGEAGSRVRVRTTVTLSEPTASSLRPVLVRHDASRALVSLVPDGALLLAGDAVELDVAVDAGARLDLVEPGGTVAFGMRGGTASWSVRITLGAGSVLTWAGEPFVVAAGARVRRTTSVRMPGSARLALRETLVLGRAGEGPGTVRQCTQVSVDRAPVLVDDLPLDPGTAPGLIGPHRVLATVLAVGGTASGWPDQHRYDLDGGGCLWRRLGRQAHSSGLADAWRAVARAD